MIEAHATRTHGEMSTAQQAQPTKPIAPRCSTWTSEREVLTGRTKN
ncbi:MAG: hypothetical protein ACLFVO_28490 [Chloroflexaceae bacterium]